jgi:hypothetical protein
MNVGIGTEAAQFPKKEYINVIFVAVQSMMHIFSKLSYQKQAYFTSENVTESTYVHSASCYLTNYIFQILNVR